MVEPAEAQARPDRPAARRTLSVVIRVGAVLLASGAATDEVEVAMRDIARASGLEGVHAIVEFGTISVSYAAHPDAEPITFIRLARNRATDYARLAAASDLTRRLIQSRMTVDEALHEIDRIESLESTYPRLVTWIATGAAAGASSVLFGGGLAEIGIAMITVLVAEPFVIALARSGLPPFFHNVLGPAIVTVVVVLLAVARLPVNGSLVVTGAILIFLPGGALAAGMRDLIDGSIVSGTARVFEAIMLGVAVGIGVSIGLAIGAILGPDVNFVLPTGPTWAIAVQALAAAVACGAFAIRGGVPRGTVLSIGLVGAAGLAAERLLVAAGVAEIVATTLGAAVIGAMARWLARRHGSSATIWIGAAILPLVPGLILVQGLLSVAEGGALEVMPAIIYGFAIGIGCALGDVVVAALRVVNRSIVQPVVVGPVAGLVDEGRSWVSRAAGRRSGD